MDRWLMTIDIERCENCNNCFLACRDEHWDNDWKPYTLAQPRHGHRWMDILRKEQGRFPRVRVAYMPRPCFHCAEPRCMTAAPAGEIHKRPDGIVIIDPEKSRGRKDLAAACPYGAIWWNPDNQTPQKCTLCAHLLDSGWEQPRCVQACPTGALGFRRLSREELENDLGTGPLETGDGRALHSAARAPLVLYRHLDLFNAGFLAGSVATEKDGIQDCVSGLAVELWLNGEQVARQITDAFGDFRFSGLRPDSGYELNLVDPDKQPVRIQIDLAAGAFPGTIWI